jgi:hypothetical protein
MTETHVDALPAPLRLPRPPIRAHRDDRNNQTPDTACSRSRRCSRVPHRQDTTVARSRAAVNSICPAHVCMCVVHMHMYSVSLHVFGHVEEWHAIVGAGACVSHVLLAHVYTPTIATRIRRVVRLLLHLLQAYSVTCLRTSEQCETRHALEKLLHRRIFRKCIFDRWA